MFIHEIFETIQGEGLDAGFPTTFIRLQGCNLRCKYCDTKESLKLPYKPKNINEDLKTLEPNNPYYNKLSEDDIISKVVVLNNHYICITGGEPLLQEGTINLANRLTKLGYKVDIETNGSIARPKELSIFVRLVIDIKCPNANLTNYDDYTKKLLNCLLSARTQDSQDIVKIVVSDLEDISFIERFLVSYNQLAMEKCKPTFDKITKIISPIFDVDGKISKDSKEVVKWLLMTKPANTRIGIQLHKIIGVD